MTVKQKQTLIIAGIVGFWLLLLGIFIRTHAKAALFIIPIFTVMALGYLAYLSFWGIEQAKKLDAKPTDKPVVTPAENKEGK